MKTAENNNQTKTDVESKQDNEIKKVDKSAYEQMKDEAAKMKTIIGMGELVSVMTGMVEGKPIIEDFNFTPALLIDVPELFTLIMDFSDIIGKKNGFGEKEVHNAAKIIQISLKKSHGVIPTDMILKKFDLPGLAKAVKIAVSLNDFLAEMQPIKEIAH